MYNVTDQELELMASLKENHSQIGDKFSLAGTGSLAKVYYHRHQDIAVKILFSEDAGYEAYINAILQCKSNPYYPKVFNREYLASGQTMYVIERLYNIGDSRFTLDQRTKYFNEYDSIQDTYFGISHNCPKMATKNPDLLDALETIWLANLETTEPTDWDEFGLQDVSFDMHYGNCMARANGQLVIIDPLCDNLALEYNDGEYGHLC